MKQITLCGSMQTSEARNIIYLIQTALTEWGYMTHAPVNGTFRIGTINNAKNQFIAVHEAKIAMSDLVIAISKMDRSYGSGTEREIRFAQKLGKRVIHFFPTNIVSREQWIYDLTDVVDACFNQMEVTKNDMVQLIEKDYS